MTTHSVVASSGVGGWAETVRRGLRLAFLSLVLLFCGAALGLIGLHLAAELLDGYGDVPSPDGMVVRVAIGEVTNPIGRVTVEPAPDGRAAFVVRNPFARDGAPSCFEVAYPSGETRALESTLDLPAIMPVPPLDLDGDGVDDRLWIGDGQEWQVVRVLSGADGTTLFEDRDAFEYAHRERAFPLGDLDGDGFGELALVHPRQRRVYDFHALESMRDPHGWITVVSGARLAR